MLPLAEWFGQTGIAQAIHNSSWLFPFIEIFHLLSLGVLGGTVMLVNLRLLGMVFPGKTAPELSRDVAFPMKLSLTTMLVSGWLLFMSEATKMYTNDAFRIKMLFLALALVFTYTIHRKVANAAPPNSPVLSKLVALVSVLLWSGVGLAGRAIGFV